MIISIILIVFGSSLPLFILIFRRLRKQGKAEQKASANENPSNTSTSPEIKRPDTPAAEGVRFERDGEVGFVISRLSQRAVEARQWKKLSISSDSEAWLTPYLKHASEFLGAPLIGLTSTSGKYRLVFDGAGELMRSKSGDGFRAILVDRHSHRIASHGLLTAAANSVAAPMILWECAATIVGRKYLADIDRRLSAIENGIASLRAFLENQRIGTLQADCRSISEYLASLKQDPSFVFRRQNVQQMIDVIDRNASGVVRSCLLDLDVLRGEVERVSLTAIASVDLSEVEKHIATAVQTLQIAALALGIRLCCAGLLNSYMEEVQLRDSRLRDCADLWNYLNRSSMEFQVALNSKLNSLKEYLSFRETEEEKKDKAKQRSRALFLDAAKALKMTKDDLGRVKSEPTVFSAVARPIELSVTLGKNGEILETLVATTA